MKILFKLGLQVCGARLMDAESAVESAFSDFPEYKPTGPVEKFRVEVYGNSSQMLIWGEEYPKACTGDLFRKHGVYIEVNGVPIIDTVDEDDDIDF